MVIKTFNLTYFLLLALIPICAGILTWLMKGKNEDARRKLLMGICLFNIVFYVVYKFGLYLRTPGLPDSYVFDAWKELPLHLCNISLFLVPIGLRKRSDSLLAYGVYIAPLGALMALTFPSGGFGDLNIFYPHMLGYYGTHFIIVLVGVLLVSLGLYKPTFRKIPAMFVLILLLSLGAHLVNLVIRTLTQVGVNYFYTMEPEGISLLELFWSWLPVPYLYLLFGIVIFLVYTVLVTLPFHLASRKIPANSIK